MTSKRDCLENAKPRNKKGDGSIRKTKYGSYEYRITYTDTYGQRKRKGFTFAERMANETDDGKF